MSEILPAEWVEDILGRSNSEHELGMVSPDIRAFAASHEALRRKEAEAVGRCLQCGDLVEFDDDEPYAYCKCGTSEWGSIPPRPERWHRHIAEEKCKALEKELASAKLDAEIWENCCKKSEVPSPCGHASEYSHTEDGGKVIRCYVCQLEKAEAIISALHKTIETLQRESA